MPSFPPLRPGACRGPWVVPLLLAACFAHAHADAPGTAGRAERADPLDPQARVPAVVPPSSLASYRRLGDDPRGSWKEANETVNRIGGWRAYTREARQPAPAASAPGPRGPSVPASAPPPAGGGHRAH